MSIKTLLTQAKALQNQLPEAEPLAIPDAAKIAGWIDHTLLKPQATVDQIQQLCAEARTYQFASVCLNPVYIPLAVKELEGSNVPVCCVIGFPLGANQTIAKTHEAKAACEAGAVELDMVLSIGQLKSGLYQSVLDDIQAVAETCHANNAHLKVILEMCYLEELEKIIGCLICKEAGADFVKTSTGFGSSGATVEDVRLMRAVVGSVEEMGVKAAGGIRSWEDAQKMIAAGANRLGASSGVKIVQEAKEG